MGTYDSAVSYQVKSIVLFENILPENHPSLAVVYQNMANIYAKWEQFGQAFVYQQKSITVRENINRPVHPELVQSYRNMSEILKEMGQLDASEKFKKKAEKGTNMVKSQP